MNKKLNGIEKNNLITHMLKNIVIEVHMKLFDQCFYGCRFILSILHNRAYAKMLRAK